MSQIVTVSPTTAAYASEANKSRHGHSTPMEDAITDWHHAAVSSADPVDRALLEFVQPPSLVLAFLTKARVEPAITTKEATAAYLANSDDQSQG